MNHANVNRPWTGRSRPRTPQPRIANIAIAITYAVTIVAGAVGEWNYYILGSAIEVALLAAIAYYAWTWPRRPHPLEGDSATQRG